MTCRSKNIIRVLTVALTIPLGAPDRSFAAVIHVPADHSTISAALAAAAPNDEIQVAAGTYAPSTNGEIFPLLLDAVGISLTGAGQTLTVLDSEGGPQVVRSSASGAPRVSGFTLRGGRAARGSGVFVESGDLEIDHNLIVDNGASDRGAGVFVKSTATPWIHHNVVWENFDTDTTSSLDPHAIVFQDDSAGLVEHNLVGRTDGNGLLTSANAQPTVRHNIFLENGQVGPPLRGRGVCWLATTPAIVQHNLFHANQIAAILWTDGGGNLSGVASNTVDPGDLVYGNLDGNPLLADPNAGDFTLTAMSPAIDAGDPTAPLDPDGTVVDLGPLYFDQGATGVASVLGGAGANLQLAVSPNPFRSSVTIRWEGGAAAVDRVEIVDVAGRQVRSWSRVSRDGSVEWDGGDSVGRAVSPGVYFARAWAGTTVQTASVVRLR